MISIKKLAQGLGIAGIMTISIFTFSAMEPSCLYYDIIPSKKIPDKVLSNSIIDVQYKITNVSSKLISMEMNPILGISQEIGPNLCPAFLVLKPAESCNLNLKLDTANMDSQTLSHELGFKAASCIKPTKKVSLDMQIIPCEPGLCLPADQAVRLREATTKFREEFKIPGIVAGIWTGKNGALIIEDGWADLVQKIPVNREDHFRIASLTKTFTVTLMLQLVEQQLLELNAQAGRFIPNTQNAKASMQQLADMRSGLFNYTEDAVFMQEFAENLTKPRDPMQIVEQALTHTPYFSPEADKWHYSNTNTIILGLIVQKITGKPLGQVIEERLLQPLKLKNTFYPHTPEMPEPYAHGYLLTGDDPADPASWKDVTPIAPSVSAGSGAMVSSLEDLHNWAIALVQGKLGETQILSENMQNLRVNSMKTIVYAPCADTNPERTITQCPEYDFYGMGMGSVVSKNHQKWYGHTAEYLGYAALIMHEPVTQSTVVILMNSNGNTPDLPLQLFRKYLDILER